MPLRSIVVKNRAESKVNRYFIERLDICEDKIGPSIFLCLLPAYTLAKQKPHPGSVQRVVTTD
jgi:hypothetical protein